ncbi:SGNH hydrolase-type esterase domain-containing protein [Tricladium varicosporioides]|nr:SGNH hydrolase-type esterase domain-containing protein [Hymenoscyphus varicosporioides]
MSANSQVDFCTFTSISQSQHSLVARTTIPNNGPDLKILPLGDSITYGWGSSDLNGYRLDLRNMLSMYKVQYIGSLRSGSMANNASEGHIGALISQIGQYATLSLKELPNVILLMAGTNDMNNPVDPATAPARLGKLIDELLFAVADALILVAQLTPSATKSTAENIAKFNAAVPEIVAQRANAKGRVMVVDMSKYVTTSDLTDGLHLNDHGYARMATAWYDAIQQATSPSKAWISPPRVGNTLSGRAICNGSVQWVSRGLVATGFGNGDASNVFFADINGDGKSDYIVLDPTGEAKAWLNGGVGSDGTSINWSYEGAVARSVGKAGSTIHFADLNGDGLDDYLSVEASTGAVSMWQNRGSINGTSDIRLAYLGIVADGAGAGGGVFFADMDGDGRDDYVWVDVDGSTALWLNGGIGEDGNWIWTSKGKIANGIGATRDEIRLADIDGDGKADYLFVNKSTGVTKMWRNGGMSSDDRWVWISKGEIVTEAGTTGSFVRFADVGGTGRSDYLNITSNPLGARQLLNTCVNGSGAATNMINNNPTTTGVGIDINISPTATRTGSNNIPVITSQALSPQASTSSADRCFHTKNMIRIVLIIIFIL